MSPQPSALARSSRPEVRSRRRAVLRTGLRACAGLLVLGVGGLGLVWWQLFGREDLASARYARQVAAVVLPDGFALRREESGGTYLAAGNGPSASRSFSTPQGPGAATREVQEALDRAGYEVEQERLDPDLSDIVFGGAAGVRLTARRHGDVLTAYVSAGDVDDLPFGRAAAEPGRTSVLMVVEDHGRSR